MKVDSLLEMILEMKPGDVRVIWNDAKIRFVGDQGRMNTPYDFRVEVRGRAQTHKDLCNLVREYVSVDELLGIYYGVDPNRFTGRGRLTRHTVQLMFLEQEVNYGRAPFQRRSAYPGPRTFLAKYLRRTQEIEDPEKYREERDSWFNDDGIIISPPSRMPWDGEYRLQGDRWLDGELLEEFRKKLKG